VQTLGLWACCDSANIINAAISACDNSGQWEKAMQLLRNWFQGVT
jgi:hypothetical protein